MNTTNMVISATPATKELANVYQLYMVEYQCASILVSQFLQNLGAMEVTTQWKETGWWLGRYDRDERPFEKQVEVVS